MDAIVPGFTDRARALVQRMLALLKPPPKLRLSEWAEANIVLPQAQNPMGGRYRNWPYLIAILDDFGDPNVEQISLIKAARIGFTKGIMIALGAEVVNDPCPMILLMPTDEDARDAAVDEVEPLFESTPILKDLVPDNRLDGRKTIVRKTYKNGASLKILAARSPRKLRRHGAKIVYGDEIDAMEVTPEGDPLTLVENRTLAYVDRKLVWGSTPTEEGISNIDRKYQASDKRVFEVGCPHCGGWFELLWSHIRFDSATVEQTGKAWAQCPHNGCVIEESSKRRMVEAAGKRHDPKNGIHYGWRVTESSVTTHHGYKLNALVSLLPHTNWGKLAANFLEAKRGGPFMMQVFVNQTLAEVWSVSVNKLDAETLKERAEEIGLSNIPDWVLMLTAGVDVQDDRLEITVLGWGQSGSPAALAHHVIDGNTLDDSTWDALDKWLKRQWTHPNGWQIGIDATAIDSGGSEGRTQKVYDFTATRFKRRIFAIKGVGGARPIWKRAEKMKGGARLFLIGHDVVKTECMERLATEPYDKEGRRDENSIRISEDLPDEWFEGVTSEVRRIKYVKNRPIIEFSAR
jgi:phage terminase large subunit GpA-like protein